MGRLKGIIEFLRSKTFGYHFALALSILIILVSTIYLGLGNYTNHGEKITVPNFKGVKISELKEFIKDKDLNFKIVDSIYKSNLPRGVVIDQDPQPDYKVKEGRTIYLTINSDNPPQIRMPNLIDVSDRQAEAMLETYGLKLGQKIYKPDLAKNAVLDQLFNGKQIKAGTPIRKSSVIDLVLGDGLGNTKVPVPHLVGLPLQEAIFVLQGSGLNKGATLFDESVKDTANAKVYKQIPEPTEGNTLTQGESVDLYITQNPEKLKGIEPKSNE